MLPRFDHLLCSLQQPHGDIFSHVSLAATWTDARGHTIHHQFYFITLQGYGREAVHSFSLPANKTLHHSPCQTSEVFKKTRRHNASRQTSEVFIIYGSENLFSTSQDRGHKP